MDVRSVSLYNIYSGCGNSENVARLSRTKKQGLGEGACLFSSCGLKALPQKHFRKQVQICAIWCILWVKYAFTGSRIEVCMGVENHTGM